MVIWIIQTDHRSVEVVIVMTMNATFGGMLSLSHWLGTNGYDLSFFRIGVVPANCRISPAEFYASIPDIGQIVSLPFRAAKNASGSAVNVALETEDGGKRILFFQPQLLDALRGSGELPRPETPVCMVAQGPDDFTAFVNAHVDEMENLARWGKPDPTWADHFSLYWRPRKYKFDLHASRG